MELTREGDVFVLTLKSGENRFHPDFMEELHRKLDEVESHKGANALVIAATGKIWSNGLDLNWLGQHQDRMEDYLCTWMRLMGRFLVFPVPTVGAIGGHAFAGGMVWAMCLDRRVMRSDRGFLCMPEIDLHMPLAPGMMQAVACKIGNVNTLRDVVLEGKRFGGEKALELGLVDDAVSLEKVLPTAVAMAQELAHKAEDGMTYGLLKKEMFRHAYTLLTSNNMGEARAKL